VLEARLVITAVVAEGRSQGEVARAYGVSQGWVSRLVARYRAEGEAAFESRSRRPKTSPRAIPEATVELIVALRKDLSGPADPGASRPQTSPADDRLAIRHRQARTDHPDLRAVRSEQLDPHRHPYHRVGMHQRDVWLPWRNATASGSSQGLGILGS
jgi:hypothetical protein